MDGIDIQSTSRRGAIAATLALGAGLQLRVLAQGTAQPRVIVLWVGNEATVKAYEEAVLAGLADRGYAQGKNVQVEFRYGRGDPARIREQVDEMVGLKPEVMVTIEQPAVLMQTKTKTIPIVLLSAPDPVAAGLAKSLSRPDSNVTGMWGNQALVLARQFDLLKEILPKISRITILNDATIPGPQRLEQATREAGSAKGVEVTAVYLKGRDDLDRAISEVGSQRPDAMIVAGTGLTAQLRRQIGDAALRLRIPASMPQPEFAISANGLLAYAGNLAAAMRYAMKFVDQILKGTNPGEIPIELFPKFDLIVNLKTAKELGIAIPQSILARTDRLIE